ncbi:hypothetical protein EVAR_63635_1 [Eumeta japonica]|uniref:Uncharacterized protein n=1 Tax=Eumeta variegata TaxID=151549 RepID=A0A4C1ZVU8_EUMVA|nr:hypothetical protein EVAR_63635_1 [Eumeta japonica]
MRLSALGFCLRNCSRSAGVIANRKLTNRGPVASPPAPGPRPPAPPPYRRPRRASFPLRYSVPETHSASPGPIYNERIQSSLSADSFVTYSRAGGVSLLMSAVAKTLHLPVRPAPNRMQTAPEYVPPRRVRERGRCGFKGGSLS